MGFCGNASAWAKVALVLIIVALVVHATGFGTNYWMARYTVRDVENYGVGLWRMTNCSGYYKAPCTESAIPDSFVTNYVQATRGMESCTLILIVVAMVCLIFYVATSRSRTRGMAISVLVIVFISAACSITGMVVWIHNLPYLHYVNWSFGLTVFSATLSITAGILLIPDIREYDYKDVLRVGGEFNNLAVTRDESPVPPPPPEPDMYRDELKPSVMPQNPLAAPTYEYMRYDKRKERDGF